MRDFPIRIQKVALLILCVIALTKICEVEPGQGNTLRKDSPRRMSSDDKRPVMHTFYEKVSEGEDELLELWKSEWNRMGFDTKILTLADAKANPHFEDMEKLVKPIFGETYNGLCFYRWLAMVQDGGGWMSDYDTLPTNFPIEDGLNLPNGGHFTSFEAHVPSLMSGSKEEWMRVTNLLIEAIPQAREKFGLPSDMNAFLVIRNEGNHDIDFGVPYHNIRPGYHYKEPRVVDCSAMKIGRAIHFSHQKTHQAFALGLFPVDLPKDAKPSSNHRAEGSSIFMNDWREQCKNEILEAQEQSNAFVSPERS